MDCPTLSGVGQAGESCRVEEKSEARLRVRNPHRSVLGLLFCCRRAVSIESEDDGFHMAVSSPTRRCDLRIHKLPFLDPPSCLPPVTDVSHYRPRDGEAWTGTRPDQLWMGADQALKSVLANRRVGLTAFGRLGLRIVHGRKEFLSRLHDNTAIAARNCAAVAGIIHLSTRHIEAPSRGRKAPAAAGSAS